MNNTDDIDTLICERMDEYLAFVRCEENGGHKWGPVHQDETLGWCKQCSVCECWQLCETPN